MVAQVADLVGKGAIKSPSSKATNQGPATRRSAFCICRAKSLAAWSCNAQGDLERFLSDLGHSTIDEESDARDIARFTGSEKRNGLGDLVGISHSA